MPSKKVISADNQQERIEICGWITGFVDGEGSFLVNIFRSPRAKSKWQIFPEFNVSQSLKGKGLLDKFEKFFACGHIYAHNARNIKQGKWDPLYKYCVRSRNELKEKIIPFFKKYPPIGKSKKNDFERFVRVVEIMDKKEHLTKKGMRKIAKIAGKMTHRKPFKDSSIFKFLLSSETIRQGRLRRQDIVRPA